ncbi:GtrA family protein [Budvicia aquatica]|uniref:GtrA family protein n=1 Tax=Budvicia aquatica TaxID=82979 RepID=UPI002080C691|nr:GtrA family protein [Budvicia aquatica]GKX50976.1 bactoprenol-linked glucose translocase [Budvicia aquatica]
MLKLFTKYLSIGVINTLIHWAIFAVLVYLLSMSQAVSNLLAFCAAVTFSFFANARFTFKAKATSSRYLIFVGFMGALSLIIGWMADKSKLSPIFTLIVFSAISLVCGFLYSKFVVFRSGKA